MTIWIERQEPEHRPGKPRTPAQITQLLTDLQANPGRWALYSTHDTRGAAKVRISRLRKAASFQGYPLEWAYQRQTEVEISEPIQHQVVVRWRA